MDDQRGDPDRPHPARVQLPGLRPGRQAEGSEYDWTSIDKLLDEVSGRKHQAVIRWHDTYVGKPTRVPAYIKALPDYRETTADSEKQADRLPRLVASRSGAGSSWSSSAVSPRNTTATPELAFVEVGFGLWSEYHIYEGPMVLGQTFPAHRVPATSSPFAKNGETLHRTPWMISVDAAGDHTPFASDKKVRALPFGLFDDSFNHAPHAK